MKTLNQVLEDLAFHAPVSVDDCRTVRDAIKAALPTSSVEVYFHNGKPGDDVVITVDGRTRKYRVS